MDGIGWDGLNGVKKIIEGIDSGLDFLVPGGSVGI